MNKQWNVKIDGRWLDQYEIIDELLDSRGIDNIGTFLQPHESCLIPYGKLKNIDRAAQIIMESIDGNGTFLVFYDTDTDGVSSGTIITRYLKQHGCNVKTYINEGKAHGLATFDTNTLCNVDVMIIVDSINNDPELYQNIIDKGIYVIVVDHHVVPKELIESGVDICLVSSANDYPNPALSGSATTWKLCKYLDEMMWTDYADNLVDLATCGLVADMCSVGLDSPENRYICSLGFQNQTNPALKKINGTYAYNSQAVSFGIAPLVNAANRMNNNENAVQLFLSDDDKEISRLIKDLKNDKEWQNLEIKKKMPELLQQGEVQLNQKCMYFYIDTDAEVSGLIGNKLLEIYQRPLFVFKETTNGEYAGSMRAIGVKDFAQIVNDTGIGRCLGHELAAGAFVPVDRFEEFKQRIEDVLANVEFKQEVDVDIQLSVEQVTKPLIEQIKNLNKISGNGFAPITVMIDDVTDYTIESMSQGKHLKIVTPNMIFIKWNFSRWDDIKEGMTFTGYGQLDCGFFGRTFYNQMILSDFKIR